MKSYQYILFDWDGSLVNTLNIWFNGINSASSNYGINLTRAQTISCIGAMHKIIEYGLSDTKYTPWMTLACDIAEKEMPNAKLFIGAKGLLKKLKAEGKSIGMVSSAHSKSLNAALVRADVIRYFDVVISGTDVKIRKPDPEGIEQAIIKMNGEKNRAVMIGDSEYDIQAAKNAGIDSILFHPSHNSTFWDIKELRKENPTYVVSSFKQLSALLERPHLQ